MACFPNIWHRSIALAVLLAVFLSFPTYQQTRVQLAWFLARFCIYCKIKKAVLREIKPFYEHFDYDSSPNSILNKYLVTAYWLCRAVQSFEHVFCSHLLLWFMCHITLFKRLKRPSSPSLSIYLYLSLLYHPTSFLSFLLFSTIFHFVFSPFHLHHASCLLTLIHLSPCFLCYGALHCFSYISPTVCGYFHVLFWFITHLWLCIKEKTYLEIVFHVYSICSAIIQHKCILNTLNAKTNPCITQT